MDLATTHLSADLDGVASLVALDLLEGPLQLVLPGAMDPTTRRFWSEHRHELPPLRTGGKAELQGELGTFWVVDTADPARIGTLAELAERFERVRAIDNHSPSPGDFPREPLPPCAAVTSALVMRLAERGISPSPTQAGLFLLGIHVDTGHFTYPGTRALDLRAAAQCMEWEAPLDWVPRYLPKGYTAHQLRMLEQMSRSLELAEAGGSQVALLALETESYEPDLAVLVEQLRAAEGWPAAFLLAGGGDRVDAIGRSDGRVDVAEVLRPLGGGGHAVAASASIRGTTLRDARAILRDSLTDSLSRRRTAKDLAVHPFHSITSTTTVREAGDRLHQWRINSLPIVQGRGARVVGMVTRPEVEAALRHGLADAKALEISAGPPAWVSPDAPLTEVREKLISGRRLLMVGTPPGDAVGILTRGTVFRALQEPPIAGHARPPQPAQVAAQARSAMGERWEMALELGRLGAEQDWPVHLVGGTVRDLFLGLPIRDVDLVVEGPAPRLAKEAARRFGGKAQVHEAFGTAKWIGAHGETIDLASARSEHYEAPAALPHVALHAGLRQDLFRRDFTFNAIAISVHPQEVGRVHDPYGGLADLRAGTLRVLHGVSFLDDPTRAFRAARFCARFDFEPAPETLGLIATARRAGAFERLSRERLGWELELILGQREVVQAFRLLREWRLLEAIHPNFHLGRTLLDRISRLRLEVSRVEGFLESAPSQADVLWIAIASAIPRKDRRAASRMVLGSEVGRRRFREGHEKAKGVLGPLSRVRRRSAAARLLRQLDEAEAVYALSLAPGEEVRERIEWWLREGRKVKAAIDGDVLLSRGARPGPAVGRALSAALDAALDGKDEAAQLRAAERVLAKG